MSEIFENDNNEKEETPLIVSSPEPIKEKPKKPRKPMSEERRKVLLQNLQRGRETAKLNRQRAAMAKRIIKNKKKSDVEKVIEQDIFERSGRPNLEEQIKELKEAMKELKAGKKPKEQSDEEKQEITRLKEEIKQLKENNKKSEEIKKEVLQPITEEPKPTPPPQPKPEPIQPEPAPTPEPSPPKPPSPGPPVQIFQQTTRKRRSYWSTLS